METHGECCARLGGLDTDQLTALACAEEFGLEKVVAQRVLSERPDASVDVLVKLAKEALNQDSAYSALINLMRRLEPDESKIIFEEISKDKRVPENTRVFAQGILSRTEV